MLIQKPAFFELKETCRDLALNNQVIQSVTFLSPSWRSLLGLLPLESGSIDFSITTRARVGHGGKLWVLRQITDPSAKIWHADDNKDIVAEIIQQAAAENVASAKVAAIRVPKHWRSQRSIQVYNLLEGHVNSPSQKGYQQNCQEGGGCNLFSAFFFTWGGSTACSPICSLIDRGPP